MALNDTVADLLTRMRNAMAAEHKYVDVLYSKLIRAVAQVMQDQGFIKNFIVSEERHTIRIFLKYTKERESVIQGLKRVSKPGLRRYVGCDDIPNVLGGLGVAIVSTPKGVMDGKTAKKSRVGGELLCCLW